MKAEYSQGPLQLGDVPELSRFLTRGFGLPAGAECMSPEVLRWKYLPDSVREPRGFLTRTHGQIVGHVGLSPRSFVVRGGGSQEVPTTHPIDWLASPDHPSVGLALLLRGCRSAPTQYSVGGTAVAQKMLLAVGFESRCRFRIFHKVLRPFHRRLALEGQGLVKKGLGAVRDGLAAWRRRGRAPRRRVEVCRVTQFGQEVAAVLGRHDSPLVFSGRSADLLNDYLRYPGGNFSGWTVQEGQTVIGFALVNIVPNGRLRLGRIVECFLDRPEPALFHAALTALVQVVQQQSADEVTCFASTPWMTLALEQCGFVPCQTTDLLVRDKNNLLPRDLPYHVTQLEGDHAYLE